MRIPNGLLGLGILGVFALSGGCGLLGLSAEQCETNADCNARGPAFAGLVCGPANTCVSPAKGEGTPVAASSALCESTEQCTASNGNRPSVCRAPGQEPCVNLATDACSVVVGSWDDPNAVLFGTITQNRTKDVAGEQYGRATEAGITLGIREFNSTVGGLQGVGNTRRPLAAVFCSVEGLAPQPERDAAIASAVQHLASQVKVAAIFTQDEHMAVPAREPALNAGVFHNCPQCSTQVPPNTNGLEWHGLQSWESGLPLYNWLVASFEEKIRANPAYGLGPDDPIRVAVSSSNTNEYVGSSGDSITSYLTFNNGKPLAQNLNNFLRTNVSSWLSPDNSAQSYTAAKQIAAFKPHIVITANDLEGGRLIIPLVESQWSGSQPPPYYISNVVPAEQAFFNTLTTDESLRKRFAGVAAYNDPDPGTLALQAGFLGRIPTVFPAGQVPPMVELIFASVVYDSFMSTVFAISAAAVNDIKAADVRTGMSRLVAPGPVLDLTSANFGPILAALGAGGNVQLRGTFGHINWDQAQHHRAGYNAAFCGVRDMQTGNTMLGDLGPYQIGDTVTGSFFCF